MEILKNIRWHVSTIIGSNRIVSGFPGGTSGKEPTANAGDLREAGLIPGLGRFPWRRAQQPTPVYLPGESHGQRSLVVYSPWSHKESDNNWATKYARTQRIVSLPWKFSVLHLIISLAPNHYVSSMSFHSLGTHFLIALNDIPFPGCTTVYISIHLLKDILVTSKFCQLWIKLLQASVCSFLCGHTFQFLRVSIKVRSYAQSIFTFVRTCQTMSQSCSTILHSHQSMRIKTVPLPYQHLILSVFCILDILTVMQWYLIVLIYIKTKWYIMWNILIYLFAIFTSSLVRNLF